MLLAFFIYCIGFSIAMMKLVIYHMGIVSDWIEWNLIEFDGIVAEECNYTWRAFDPFKEATKVE